MGSAVSFSRFNPKSRSWQHRDVLNILAFVKPLKQHLRKIMLVTHTTLAKTI